MGVSAGEPVHPDLNAILHGGDVFIDRVKKLADQRNAIEGMLKDLALGREARAAYDDAERKGRAARAQVAAAEERSAFLLKDANERSTQMLKEAQDRHDKATSDAAAAKKEADALLADARAKNLAATAREREAVRLRDQHVTALKAAQDTQKAFRDRSGRLNTFLKDLMAE